MNRYFSIIPNLTRSISNKTDPYKNSFIKLNPKSQYTDKVKACILGWSGVTIDPFVIATNKAIINTFKKNEVTINMKEVRDSTDLKKDLHIKKILNNLEIRERWEQVKIVPPTYIDVQKLCKQITSMQITYLPKYSKLLPNLIEIINELKKKDIKIGTTTEFTNCIVEVILKETKNQGYEPDSNITKDQIQNNIGCKPTPFMIYQNLIQMGINPIQSVVKVDSTISGIAEGINAGCWSVGVYGWSNYMNIDTIDQWNNMSTKERDKRIEKSKDIMINESNAHYVIKDLSYLPDVIDDINCRLRDGDKP